MKTLHYFPCLPRTTVLALFIPLQSARPDPCHSICRHIGLYRIMARLCVVVLWTSLSRPVKALEDWGLIYTLTVTNFLFRGRLFGILLYGLCSGEAINSSLQVWTYLLFLFLLTTALLLLCTCSTGDGLSEVMT